RTPPASAAAPKPPGPQGVTWLMLRQKADLSPAFGIRDWNARGRFVVERLQAVARTSQAPLLNELTTRGVRHQSLWIVNAVRVDADATTLKELARRPEVERIIPEGTFYIPK